MELIHESAPSTLKLTLLQIEREKLSLLIRKVYSIQIQVREAEAAKKICFGGRTTKRCEGDKGRTTKKKKTFFKARKKIPTKM